MLWQQACNGSFSSAFEIEGNKTQHLSCTNNISSPLGNIYGTLLYSPSAELKIIDCFSKICQRFCASREDYMSLNIKFLQGLGARVLARKGLSYRLIRMLRQIAEGFGQGIQLAPNINGDAGETVEGLDCVSASKYQHPVANNPTAVAVSTGRWASNAAELVPPVEFWLQIPRHVSIRNNP